MKRLLCIILVFGLLFSLVSCGPNIGLQNMGGAPIVKKYNVNYHQPEPQITEAPPKTLLDWDIKSVKNPYADIDFEKDYSMPVYKIDTYDEFLHLTKIIGSNVVPTKSPVIDDKKLTIDYYDYRDHTFDEFCLLLGWATVEGYHSAECYGAVLDDDVTDVGHIMEGDALDLYFFPSENCNCSQVETQNISFLIWIALPIEDVMTISKFSFVLVDCFAPGDEIVEEAPGGEQNEEN